MQLSHAQKLSFYENGLVRVPGVVPHVMVSDALRAINNSIGQGMPPDHMTKFRAQSYCPELQAAAAITDLYKATPLRSVSESLVGEGKIKPVHAAQIALRFPSMQDPPDAPRPHLDGMYSPTNGVAEGTIQNFTMLCAVLLSELREPFCGNLTVWPGTHHQYERYFREHGPQSLLNGMPPIDLPEPLHVTGQPGDVVLAHYELAHSAAMNVSPHVRYAIFFRLTHVDHDSQKWESMTDIWREYAGMQQIVRERRAKS